MLGDWGSSMYMRAHCCINVANRADVVLSKRFKSHNMFTQIMEALGMDGVLDVGTVYVTSKLLG